MLLVVVVGAGLLLAGAGSSVLVSGLAVLLVVVVGAGLLLMMPLCSADGADDAFVLGTALGTMLGSADGAAVPCALGALLGILLGSLVGMLLGVLLGSGAKLAPQICFHNHLEGELADLTMFLDKFHTS